MYEVGSRIYFRDKDFYARFGTIIKSEFYHIDPDVYMLTIRDDGMRTHYITRIAPQSKDEEKRIKEFFERCNYY